MRIELRKNQRSVLQESCTDEPSFHDKAENCRYTARIWFEQEPLGYFVQA